MFRAGSYIVYYWLVTDDLINTFNNHRLEKTPSPTNLEG